MRISTPLCSILFLTSTSFAADMKTLDTFDFYAAPNVGISNGTFEAGNVDKGTFTSFNYGARLGFKVGPILLGGEFAMLRPWRRSSKKNLSAANSAKYTFTEGKDSTRVGVNLGLFRDRVVIWGNYYPAASLETEGWEGLNKYKNTYDGNAYSEEINFRVWDRLYVGAFGLKQEYKKYSSTNSTNVVKDKELSPRLSVESYGLAVSYLFPISELSKIGSWFPTL